MERMMVDLRVVCAVVMSEQKTAGKKVGVMDAYLVA